MACLAEFEASLRRCDLSNLCKEGCTILIAPQIKDYGENEHEREWIFNAHLPSCLNTPDEHNMISTTHSGVGVIEYMVEKRKSMLMLYSPLDLAIEWKVGGYIIHIILSRCFSLHFLFMLYILLVFSHGAKGQKPCQVYFGAYALLSALIITSNRESRATLHTFDATNLPFT